MADPNLIPHPNPIFHPNPIIHPNPPTYDQFFNDNEPVAVFVDTNLNTSIAVSIAPCASVFHLKQQIALQHFNCFQKFGRIMIKDLMVKVNKKYYLLPEAMLVKSVFHGSRDAWMVTADVWRPGNSVDIQRHIIPPIQHDLSHQLKYIEPSTQHDRRVEKVYTDLQPTVKPKENAETNKNAIKTGTQNRKTVQQEHLPLSDLKEQLTGGNKPSVRKCLVHNLPAVAQGPSSNIAANLNKESETPNFASPPGSEAMKSKRKKNIKVANQSNAPVTNNGNALPEKGGAPSNNGNTINRSEQEDLPLMKPKINSKKRKACGIEQESQEAAPKVLPSLLNNIPELLAEGESLNVVEKVKEIGEAVSPSELVSTGKKRKTKKAKSSITSQDLSSRMPNDSEKTNRTRNRGELLLPDDIDRSDENVETTSVKLKNPLGSSKKQRPDEEVKEMASPMTEFEEAVAPSGLENTGKKRKKTKKAKSSSTTQDLSSRMLNDSEKTDGAGNRGELFLSDNIGRSDEIVETTSVKLKNPLGSSKKQQLEEEMKEMASPITENEEAVAPSEFENTGKKRKTKKTKSSSTTQDLSGRMPNDGEKTDGTRNHGELLLPGDIGRSDEYVETMSVKQKNSLGSSKKQQLDEDTMEMASPITAIQSDKPNKKRQKKQPVPEEKLPSVLGNQHSNETKMEMGATNNVDDNDQECRKTADVASLSLPNDISNGMLSQVEPSKLIGKEKENKDDVAPLKSENTTEKLRTVKAKSSVLENQLLSSRRCGQDETDGTKDTRVEVSAPDDLDRSEGSVETMNRKLKKSRNQKPVPGKDLCVSPVQKQLDEEANDKSKKKTQKKRSASKIDFSSLPVDHQLDENSMSMDAPKKVEMADDLLTNCAIDDGLKNQKKVIKGEGHRSGKSEISPLEDHIGLADLKNVDKPLASKQKPKKLDDQLTFVDTSSDGLNLVESKKNTVSAKSSEFQKSINKQKDLTGVSQASVKDASKVSGTNFTMEMNANEKIDDSSTESTSSDDVQNQNAVSQGKEHDGSSPALGLEDSAVDDAKQIENAQASKQKVKKVNQSSSIDTSSNEHNLVGSKKKRGIAKTELQKSITDQKLHNSTPLLHAKHSTISTKVKDNLVPPDGLINSSGKTGVSSASSDDSSQSSEDPSMSGGSTVQKICKEVSKEPSNKLEKDGAGLRQSSRLTSREVPNVSKEKKGGLTSSREIFDDGTTSDKEDSDGSSSSTTLPPDDDSENESKEVVENKAKDLKICKENKATNKLEKDGAVLRGSSRLTKREVSNGSKEKKGGLAASRAIFGDGMTSDEEDSDDSISSTTLPADDDSENESKEVVDSKYDSPKHNGSRKVNSSALKLESVLRSSSRYKKAKLVASQSQDQDELPEFVPDSLADIEETFTGDRRYRIPTEVDAAKVEPQPEVRKSQEHQVKQVGALGGEEGTINNDVEPTTNKETNPSKPKRRKSVAVTRRTKSQLAQTK